MSDERAARLADPENEEGNEEEAPEGEPPIDRKCAGEPDRQDEDDVDRVEEPRPHETADAAHVVGQPAHVISPIMTVQLT